MKPLPKDNAKPRPYLTVDCIQARINLKALLQKLGLKSIQPEPRVFLGKMTTFPPRKP